MAYKLTQFKVKVTPQKRAFDIEDFEVSKLTGMFKEGSFALVKEKDLLAISSKDRDALIVVTDDAQFIIKQPKSLDSLIRQMRNWLTVILEVIANEGPYEYEVATHIRFHLEDGQHSPISRLIPDLSITGTDRAKVGHIGFLSECEDGRTVRIGIQDSFDDDHKVCGFFVTINVEAESANPHDFLAGVGELIAEYIHSLPDFYARLTQYKEGEINV